MTTPIIPLAKKTIRTLVKSFGLLLLVVLLYPLAALAFWGIHRLAADPGPETEKPIPVYLFADEFHADLVIPVDPADSRWDYLLGHPDFPLPRSTTKLLSIGWGSREFYVKMREWDELTFDLSLKAAFFDETVMHLTAYRGDQVDLDHPLITHYHTDEAGYGRLLAFIRASHKLDERQRAIAIPAEGYGENDIFFAANGSYHPFRTCNQWTGEALRQAGIGAPLWAPFSFAIR